MTTIRARLVSLIALSLLPVLLFATVMTVIYWHQQREAFEAQLLERVRAMSIALDRRIDGSVRLLQGLATASELDEGNLHTFYLQAAGIKSVEPGWTAIALVDASNGREILNLLRPYGEPLTASVWEWEAFQRALRTRAPALSGFARSPLRGVPSTMLFVPVVRGDRIPYVLAATLPEAEWLTFLATNPVAADATMTLLDQNGVIIARTLNHERWVGRRPAAALFDNSRLTHEGAYRSIGLEGQQFYSAHSRSRSYGWTIATGVPVSRVDTELWWSTLGVIGGALLSIAIAIGLAIVLGFRIGRPVRGLVERAHALEAGKPLAPGPSTHLREVEQVAQAFDAAARRLAAREEERTALLERERTARAEAEAARADAEAANRAKDEFLAMLGHELRNPLAAAAAAVNLLDLAGAEAHRARAHDVIKRQIAHLSRLMNDLLDAGRIATGKIVLSRVPLDLADATRRSVAALLAAGTADGYRIDLDVEEVWADADETRIEQTITNLLTNAVKYTPAGGNITVSVHPDGGDAVVRVIDSGVGIQPEMLTRVFDLFVQGDRTLERSQGGLGIGLTLARRLVELHGGTIQAESEGVGRGSTFVVRLPRIPAPAEAKRAATPDGAAAPRRVLLIEDNDDLREMLRAAIATAGHEVHVAANGVAGLEQAVRVRPEIAIVDIGLPGLDGYAVAERLRARAAAPSVLIALTGCGREEDRQRAQAAGFTLHLAKPIDPVQLLHVIDTAFA